MAPPRLSDAARERARAALLEARRRAEARTRDGLDGALARLGELAAVPPPPRTRLRDPSPAPLPRLPRPRPLRLRLPDGRIAIAVAGPAVARRDELASVARTFARNDRTAFAALAAHRRAIEELTRAAEEARARLDALEERADAAVVGFLDALGELRGRVGAVARAQGRVEGASRGLGVRARALRAELAAQRTTATVQQVTAISNALQSGALARPGSVFAPANVVLGANQLLWSLADPLLRRLGLVTGPGPSVLGLLAPVASLATAEALLGGGRRAGIGGR